MAPHEQAQHQAAHALREVQPRRPAALAVDPCQRCGAAEGRAFVHVECPSRVDDLRSLAHANRRIFGAADGRAFDTGQLRTGLPGTYKPQCRCPPNGRGRPLRWNKGPVVANHCLLRLRNRHLNRGAPMPSDQVRDIRKPVSPWFPRGVHAAARPGTQQGHCVRRRRARQAQRVSGPARRNTAGRRRGRCGPSTTRPSGLRPTSRPMKRWHAVRRTTAGSACAPAARTAAGHPQR